MSEDLLNERVAINSIYGENTFDASSDNESDQYLLTIPRRDTILRFLFPSSCT